MRLFLLVCAMLLLPACSGMNPSLRQSRVDVYHPVAHGEATAVEAAHGPSFRSVAADYPEYKFN